MSTPNLIGQQIHHYEILSHLGGGGMGVVYKAKDTKLGRMVALKFLAPQLTSDPDLRRRFVQEAKAASALDHPNIGYIHEINETDDGQLFIAMAYYEGETLKDKIANGPIPADQAIDYAAQIAKGLAKAHEADIVHRDIKPANIIITKDNTVKIVDFGLAKMTGETQLTKTGSTIGTIAYMSPEQLKGEEVDHRTDIWSLGVVLYEMVMGERPYLGEYEHQIIYQVLHDEVDLDSVPEEVRPLVQGAQRKEVNERYAEMQEVLLDLGVSEGPSSTQPSMKRKKSSKRRISAPLIAYLGASVLALSLIWWVGWGQGTRNSDTERTPNLVETRLTYSGRAHMPAVTPDGEVLAYFEAQNDSMGHILIKEIPDGRPFELMRNVGHTRDEIARVKMEWSPDGKRLGIRTRERTAAGSYAYLLHIYTRLGQHVKSIPVSDRSFFDWSADGTELVVISFDRGKKLRFIEVDTLEDREVELPVWVHHVAWSPNGEHIVVTTKTESDTNELWVLNKEGKEAKSIYTSKNYIFLPQWGVASDQVYFHEINGLHEELRMLPVSPQTGLPVDTVRALIRFDGFTYESSLAVGANRYFIEKTLEEYNILRYEVESDSEEATNGEFLTNTPSFKLAFEVSTGSEVTFLMQNASGADLYTVSMVGSELRRRTFTQGDLFADWSTDRLVRKGDKALVVTTHQGEDQLHFVDLQSGQISTRSFEGFGFTRDIGDGYDWDGKDAVVFQRDDQGKRRLAEYDLLTDSLHSIPALDTLSWVRSPRYSPDGTQIAFYSEGIRIYSKRDSTLRQLYPVTTSSERLNILRWSEDGMWIFANSYPFYSGLNSIQIVKISAIDGEVVPVATMPDGGCEKVDVSPDGAFIVAVDLCQVESDIYMLEGLDPEVN